MIEQLREKKQQIILSATQRQEVAADVSGSTWVSASAGTGKTYVLTGRILRLFMADHKLTPSQILAVTFTKAAAREMENRIRSRVGQWATCSTESLTEELTNILGRAPEERDVRRARSLFALVLDEGININTIHGFCQQILARFPLEAGVSPGFRLVEGTESAELLASARSRVFQKASEGRGQCPWAFSYYASNLSEKALGEALDAFVYNHRRFRRLFDRKGGLENTLAELAKTLNVPQRMIPEEALRDANNMRRIAPLWKNQLQELAVEMIGASSKRASDYGEKIATFWNTEEKISRFESYKSAFLKRTGEPQSVEYVVSKKLVEAMPHLADIYVKEQQRILAMQEQWNAQSAYLLSASYLHLGEEILQTYMEQKKRQNVLDFDDLIHHSAALLGDETKSAWVRYRMDSGICHVLLDEAQDTDSDQWQIVQSLIDEFYAGMGQHDEQNRTFFAVGDIKQSIYRFRGAEPHVFGSMRSYLEHQQETADHTVNIVELNASFRSTEAVLNFVDQVFEETNRKNAVDDLVESIEHKVAQVGFSGRVELWPLVEKQDDKDKEVELWPLPQRREKMVDSKTLLADKVAESIQAMLNGADVLATTGRPVSAGDIMILLRSRSLMPSLISAFDRLSLPHTGADEVNLSEDSVVDDLLALLKFLNNPNDDLSFAQTVRSPLFALTDEELYEVHQNRKSGSLWSAFYGMEKWRSQSEQLKCLLKESGFLAPYEMLMLALNVLDARGKFAAAGGAGAMRRVSDAVDAVLESALSWQRRHRGTLTGFIHDFATTSQVLKRELEGAGARIRMLTAHGSKGLEAPIVIMPDASRNFYSNMKDDRPMWQVDEHGVDELFLHRVTPKQNAPKLQAKLEDEEKERIFRDEMRLLYVALTRAKERLYIGGVHGRNYKPEASWYGHIKEAVEDRKDWQEEGENLVLHHASQFPIALKEADEETEAEESALPNWMLTNAVKEQAESVLQASDPVKKEGALEKLKNQPSVDIYKRGKIVHKLLEVLPTFAEDEREFRGEAYLDVAAVDMSERQREKMLTAALNVIQNHPELFSENSRAEVSLSAEDASGKRIEGVADRLVITENEVWVVDYKTNADVPSEVPEVYRKQLGIYRKALARIFPNHEIKAAILWTSAENPDLIWV